MFLDGGPDPLCAIQDEGGANRGSTNANNGGSETSGSSIDEALSTASESETSCHGLQATGNHYLPILHTHPIAVGITQGTPAYPSQ